MRVNGQVSSSHQKILEPKEPKATKDKEELLEEKEGEESADMNQLSSSERTPLRLYLNDIGKIPLITPAKEVELAAKIKNGCTKSKHLMVTSNLRLVVKIAGDYSNFGLPLLDLINEGNLGLIKAVERFDPAKGGKLSTYAAWWIKQSIKRALANQSKTIRLPVHLVEKISRLRKIEGQYQEHYKRDPSNEELSYAMSLPVNKVAHLKAMSIRPASLDTMVGQDESTPLGELIGDESVETPSDECEHKSVLDDLHKIVDQLDEREARVIKMRFGLDGQRAKTLEEVGVALGITRERVRQLQFSTLRRLREYIVEYERQRSEEDIEKEKVEIEKAKVIKEFILGVQETKKIEDREVEEDN